MKTNYAKLYTLRKDGRYMYNWTGADGKRHSMYDKDPYKLHLKVLEKTTSVYRPITFRDVAERWEKAHRENIGDKTWVNYKPHFEDIVSKHGDRPVIDISALDVINDLKRTKAKGYSATILSTRRSIYRMILDYAVIDGHIQYNPAIGVSLPKGAPKTRREAPGDDVIKKIFASHALPFGLFAILLVCTGLRKAEALALTWDDISDSHIRVNKALDYFNHGHPTVKEPKTKAGNRSVPVLDVLRPFIQRPAGSKPGDLVFPAPSSNRSGAGGRHMTERQYEGAWMRYCAAAGFIGADGKPIITAHNLRHATATLLYESGVDELTAQAILGHASPTTTRDIYTHLRQRQRETSVVKFNGALSTLLSET